MTLLLTGVGQMAFVPIGFTAALILNRLRNQQSVEQARRADDERRREQDAAEQAVRAQLERLNKKLALLNARGREES